VKNTTQKELKTMKTEAWRGFVSDVKKTGRRWKRAGTKYVKTHPLVLVGGGALIAGLLLFRGRRPAPTPIERSGVLSYLKTARLWIGRAFALASQASELLKREDVPMNGCRH
jgi:hypothetical protein